MQFKETIESIYTTPETYSLPYQQYRGNFDYSRTVKSKQKTPQKQKYVQHVAVFSVILNILY